MYFLPSKVQETSVLLTKIIGIQSNVFRHSRFFLLCEEISQHKLILFLNNQNKVYRFRSVALTRDFFVTQGKDRYFFSLNTKFMA